MPIKHCKTNLNPKELIIMKHNKAAAGDLVA